MEAGHLRAHPTDSVHRRASLWAGLGWGGLLSQPSLVKATLGSETDTNIDHEKVGVRALGGVVVPSDDTACIRVGIN